MTNPYVVIERKAYKTYCDDMGEGNTCIWQGINDGRTCGKNYDHCCVVCPDYNFCGLPESYGCYTADQIYQMHIERKLF